MATSDSHMRKLYPEPLLLDVGGFAEWCVRLKIMPCLDALRAFVIIKRREVSSCDPGLRLLRSSGRAGF